MWECYLGGRHVESASWFALWLVGSLGIFQVGQSAREIEKWTKRWRNRKTDR